MLPNQIFNLQQNINIGLAGQAAQYRMAPSDRHQRDLNIKAEALKQSAVLLILFPIEQDLGIVLTQRAHYNGPHGGQISFPGGKFDAKLDRNLFDTAVRETWEEIGIDVRPFTFIGELTPLAIPVSRNLVTPYVVYTSEHLNFCIDQVEVVDLYTIPLSHFTNPKNTKLATLNDFTYPYFDFEGRHIWGATAMILSELLHLLSND